MRYESFTFLTASTGHYHCDRNKKNRRSGDEMRGKCIQINNQECSLSDNSLFLISVFNLGFTLTVFVQQLEYIFKRWSRFMKNDNLTFNVMFFSQ